MDERVYSPLTAAMWMSGAVFSLAAMAVAGREIYAELNTFELMGYRSALGFVVVLLFVGFSRHGFSQIKTLHPGLHALRNIFHFAGQNLFFYGVAVIPLAQLVALEFTSPIWVALLAPLLLGERLTRFKILGVLIGFAGILIVARPGFAPLELGHFAGFGAAIGFAMTTLFTRQIMGKDSSLCVLFWMTLSQAILGFGLAAPGGITLFSYEMTPWIVVAGLCGLSGHYCLTSALYYAPASLVAPMEFARLPLIAVVGMLLYGEPLELAVLVGGGLILGGNLVNMTAERRQRLANAISNIQ